MIQLLQDTISTNKNEELLSHLIVPIFLEVRPAFLTTLINLFIHSIP